MAKGSKSNKKDIKTHKDTRRKQMVMGKNEWHELSWGHSLNNKAVQNVKSEGIPNFFYAGAKKETKRITRDNSE